MKVCKGAFLRLKTLFSKYKLRNNKPLLMLQQFIFQKPNFYCLREAEK